MALVYLIKRFFYRIFDFLRHWYVKSAKIYFNFVLDRLNRIDRTLAWRVNAKYLFQPLYKDYSIVGRALGFVLRLIRLIGTSVIYVFIFAFIILVYLIWLAIPVIIVSMVFSSNL